MNLKVTTNQKHTIDLQKPERKELKHTTKENPQATGKKLKDERQNREELQKQPENN